MKLPVLALVCTALCGLSCVTDPPPASQPTGAVRRLRPVLTGIDVLVADGFAPLAGKRVGLITNPTGVTADLRSTVDVLHAAPGVRLTALFGPEHGVRGDVYAGDKIEDVRDPRTGVQIFSLYGKINRPTKEMLADVDVLVFDIQDIGSRSYTYISSMAAAMESAAEHKVPFVVLDRPNPLGGERMEGRPLDLAYKSFVGYLPIPYLHGMTCGELARMINEQGWLPEGSKCDLTVVPMRGWRRTMTFAGTGLHWVPSSPHLPRADTALYYAATGIMGELQAISEGVGYPLPFELAGAPCLQAEAFAAELNARGLPGVYFRPLYYRPYYGTHKETVCGGVQVHLLEHGQVHLTGIQFHIMDVARRQCPDLKLFGGERDAMFDKVCGTDAIRRLFQEDRPIEAVLSAWNEGVEEFRTKRAPYLLYE